MASMMGSKTTFQNLVEGCFLLSPVAAGRQRFVGEPTKVSQVDRI